MKVTQELKWYIDEIKGAKEYKELHDATQDANKKRIYLEMYNDEMKHANYVLQMHPEIKEEVQDLKQEIADMQEIVMVIEKDTN